MNCIKTLRTFLLTMTFALLISCEKEGGNERMVSSYNETESHRAGENCMNCHKEGGSGEGWFTYAGTVYDSLKVNVYPNGTVRFYSAVNQGDTLLYTLEVDGLGNFYTTEQIEYSGNIFVSVSGDIETRSMVTPLSSGSCNSCHGDTYERVWVR